MSDEIEEPENAMPDFSEVFAHCGDAEEAFDSAPDRRECHKHPNVILGKNWERTSRDDAREVVVGYDLCPKCEDERRNEAMAEYWRGLGIPNNLLSADFESYVSESQGQARALDRSRRFAAVKRGFLIFTGNTGTGKDHLATSIAKEYRSFRYMTHGAWLSALRSTYGKGDGETVRFIESLQETPLLVFSELGVSSGGKDEQPAFYEILNYRYENKLPTVINTNLEKKKIEELLGSRLMSRIREAIFDYIECDWEDFRQRKESRHDYFA